MINNIKRSLGVSTKIEWVNDIQQEKDTQSSIKTTFPINSTKHICKLFSDEGIDLIHKNLAKSSKIILENIKGFQKIIIHNKGHTDITIEIINSEDAQIYVEIIDESTHQFLSTGLTFVSRNNKNMQLITNIINQENKLHLFKEQCIIENKSDIVWFTQISGTSQVIMEQEANLNSPNSSIKTITLTNETKNSKFDISINSHHVAENTTSDILFRSVLESSKVLLRGLVKIDSTAANSKGNQKSDILLLDKKAKAITIPNLEIENKDVTCSHGSTTSTISKEKLFYLESRGLTIKDAKTMIIKGFIDELYTYISSSSENELRGYKNEK